MLTCLSEYAYCLREQGARGLNRSPVMYVAAAGKLKLSVDHA